MSHTRLFQRFSRSSAHLQNTLHSSYHNIRSKTQSLANLRNIGKTTSLISSGLLLGWSVHSLSSSNDILANNNSLPGKVYSWGFNRYGQLGVGSESNENLPTEIAGLHDITFISCGSEQSAALTEDGKVYTFGRSQDARLGHGETSGSNETYPRLVEELSDHKVVWIDAGYGHMACVTSTGEVWTWGKNTYSQLGHDKTAYPNVVRSLQEKGVKAVKVACGRYHTVVLTDDGKVWAWGGWKSGETGTGNKRTTAQPTQVSSLSDKRIVDVQAGQDFTLFLSEDGELYACGAGDRGQTGQGSSNARCHVTPTVIPQVRDVARMAAGQFHSICCTRDGNVFTFGLNHEGQLGHGDTQNRTVPTQVMGGLSEGKVVDVAAGGGHSACVVEGVAGRQLYIFGRGRQGQMGRGNIVGSVAANRPLPVCVDYFDELTCGIEQVVLGTNHSAVLCCMD